MSKIKGVDNPTKNQLQALKEAKAHWLPIAKKSKNYDADNFYVQVWVDGDGKLLDAVWIACGDSEGYDIILAENPTRDKKMLRTLNLKDFPKDDTKHPRQCECCGKGMTEGFLIWDDTRACSQDCFNQILYDADVYCYTEWYLEDEVNPHEGDATYDSNGNEYYIAKYLPKARSGEAPKEVL